MTLITIDEQAAAMVAILDAATLSDLTNLVLHPDALQNRYLPCTIFSPGPAQYERNDSTGNLRVTRQWKLKLFVMTKEEGREYQVEATLRPYLTAIPDALAPHPNIRLADGRTFEMTLDRGSDSGLSVLRYGDKEYGGTLFTITTIDSVRVMPER